MFPFPTVPNAAHCGPFNYNTCCVSTVTSQIHHSLSENFIYVKLVHLEHNRLFKMAVNSFGCRL